jgi:hypothetical protein
MDASDVFLRLEKMFRFAAVALVYSHSNEAKIDVEDVVQSPEKVQLRW